MKLREKTNLKSFKDLSESDNDEKVKKVPVKKAAASKKKTPQSQSTSDESDYEKDFKEAFTKRTSTGGGGNTTKSEYFTSNDEQKAKLEPPMAKKVTKKPQPKKKPAPNPVENDTKPEDSNETSKNGLQKHVEDLLKHEAKKEIKPKNSTKNARKATDLEKNVDQLLKIETMDVKASTSKKKKKKPPEEEDDEDDDEEMEDWEEVRMEHNVDMSRVGHEPIQIVLNAKKEKKKLDPKAKYERMRKALLKKLFLLALKTHLISWLAHGFYLNNLCLEKGQLFHALLLSIPDYKPPLSIIDLATLKSFLIGLRKILIDRKLDEEEFLSTSGQEIMTQGELTVKSYLDYVLVVLAALRSLGLKVRLCVCFDVIKRETDPLVSIGGKRKSDEEENDQQPKEKKAKRPPDEVKKPNNLILSMDEDSITHETVKNTTSGDAYRNYWLEVYLDADGRWCPVEPFELKFNCEQYLETRFEQRVLYVCAFDNDNRVKDVTRRYASEWTTKTRLSRIEHLDDKKLWWERALFFHQPLDVRVDMEEEKQLNKMLLEQPLPQSVSDYKDHPLYVLPRHLLKFQAIYPPNVLPVSHFRDEPVFSRDNLVTLHSKQTWLKFARVVKPSETPYKIVKGRLKRSDYKAGMRDNPDLDIYGYWQTWEYQPPCAQGGRVPKNDFGNVELFQPRMLPYGCVHLKGMPNLSKVARKLNIDIASAVVGFDAHGGFSHAVYDGWVVCKEHKDILIDAYREEEIEMHKKLLEKNQERIMGNWKRLISRMIIRERLKLKHEKRKENHLTTKMLIASKFNDLENVQMDEQCTSSVADPDLVGGKLNKLARHEQPAEAASIESAQVDVKRKNAIRQRRAAPKKKPNKKKANDDDESDEYSPKDDNDDDDVNYAKKRRPVRKRAAKKSKFPKSESENESTEEAASDLKSTATTSKATVTTTEIKTFKQDDDGDLKLSESDDDDQ